MTDSTVADDTHIDSDEQTHIEVQYAGYPALIPADPVTEIADIEMITRVPNTPSAVAGITDLRGNVVTLVDPAQLMNNTTVESDSLAVIFNESDIPDTYGSVGWLVDTATDVRQIAEDDLTSPPSEYDAPWITGVVNWDGTEDLIRVLDPEQALSQLKN